MEINFTDEPTGAAKLEAVARVWGEIQAENKAHRKWVTDSQWEDWVKYDKETAHSLTSIIDRYDGVQMTAEDDATLDRIISVVESVKRITEEEFISKQEAERLSEEQRKMQEEAEAKKKEALGGFKQSLKSFFHL